MAQSVSLWGATYSDVPAIEVPKSGGGTASFTDTSDATVTADKILSGYTAYGADGSKLTGTATAGGSVTQDQDGFIVLPSTGGGAPSASGLVYETGTWTPSEDIVRPTISFTNTHTDIPICILFSDATGTYSDASTTNYAFSFLDYYRLTGATMSQSTTSLTYAIASFVYRASSASTLVTSVTQITNPPETAGTGSLFYNYFVTSAGFIPWGGSNSRYWRAGRTYKWIAVWAPTT